MYTNRFFMNIEVRKPIRAHFDLLTHTETFSRVCKPICGHFHLQTHRQHQKARDTPQKSWESVILVKKMKMLIFSFHSCGCAPLVSGSQKIHYRYYRECIANIVNVLLVS